MKFLKSIRITALILVATLPALLSEAVTKESAKVRDIITKVND